jgi:type VI secretion system secreted protein Hcp
MPFDTYLKLEGIEGEATAKGHEKEIEIYSFSWGASNPTSVGAGKTGLSASRVSISSFNVMKKTEKSSNTLFAKCCQGAHIPSAIVTMRKATGEGGQKPFLVYTFTNVMVESIQWSGSTGGDDTPTESVSFAFEKVETSYQQQDSKGGAVGNAVKASWDLTTVSKD